jgi:hypothetical protein
MAYNDPPSGPAQCFNCGAETEDWDEIGYRKVWVCGAQRCHRELRDENRAIEDNARYDAEQDGYERYR